MIWSSFLFLFFPFFFFLFFIDQFFFLIFFYLFIYLFTFFFIFPVGLQTRSDSMASVYSASGENRYGTVAVRGEIQFGLHYNYRQTTLEVFVKQSRDLAPVDIKRNRSDP